MFIDLGTGRDLHAAVVYVDERGRGGEKVSGMKVKHVGEGEYPFPTSLEVKEGVCSGCLAKDNSTIKPVIPFDFTDGEYITINLCHDCLLTLAATFPSHPK